MPKVCKRGHPVVEANIRWHRKPSGRCYYICKPCQAFRQRMQYRHDDAYREREKTRTRSNYHSRICCEASP